MTIHNISEGTTRNAREREAQQRALDAADGRGVNDPCPAQEFVESGFNLRVIASWQLGIFLRAGHEFSSLGFWSKDSLTVAKECAAVEAQVEDVTRTGVFPYRGLVDEYIAARRELREDMDRVRSHAKYLTSFVFCAFPDLREFKSTAKE